MSRLLATLAAAAVIVSSFAITTNVALGHERRAVGAYTFVVKAKLDTMTAAAASVASKRDIGPSQV